MTSKLRPDTKAPNRPGQNGQRATPGRPSPAGSFAGQRRRRLLRTDALTVFAWGSVAAAVALWLADGGATVINSPPSTFTALGIVAGLAGLDLVLLMLLLAARLPFVDRTIGHDRALQFTGGSASPRCSSCWPMGS